MTTIKRFTPDYKMHAVRFEAFAREAEHGEYVQFDAHQQAVRGLEAERDALAVENACLVRAITDHKNSTHFCERCGEDDPCATDDVCSVLRGIPDTDSAIAAFEAQGVEKFADMCREKSKLATTADSCAGWSNCSVHASSFAIRLREAK